MRYAGRMKVSKVDFRGNKIKGSVTAWRLKNPGTLVFDSKLEYECYTFLKGTSLKFEYQPKVDLFSGITTKEFVKGVIKDVKQRAIGYTPDFYLPKYDIYIESKGYADPLFKLRWKLFKIQGNKGYLVYSLKELKDLLKLIKEDTNDVRKT